jgi:acyl-CoA synthetase (AMP-forming)/AMP-acid ligase II
MVRLKESAMWLHAEIRTLADIPRHWASVTPDKTALTDARRTLTYAQLDDRASRIAAAIAAAGIAPGSHIGFLGKNSVEFFEVWFGAARAGCALAPLNWRSAEAELAELVKDARIPLLMAGTEFAEAAHRIRDAAGADVVVFGAAGPGSSTNGSTSSAGPVPPSPSTKVIRPCWPTPPVRPAGQRAPSTLTGRSGTGS